MKIKNMKKLILIVVILVVLILTVVLIVYFSKPKGYEVNLGNQGFTEETGGYVSGAELSCVTDTKEEAESIAAVYNIELVDWVEGMAVFHTEESPADVVKRGKEENLPEIQINYVYHMN